MVVRPTPDVAQAVAEAVLDFARSLKALDPPTLPPEANASMRAMQDDLRALFKPGDAPELDTRILGHGARLLASILDPAEPLGLPSLPPEIAAPAWEVLTRLTAIGAMEPYRNGHGGFGL